MDNSTSIEQGILNFVKRANWILLACLTLGGVTLDTGFAAGIACGGLLVTINFHLLARTVRNAFVPCRVVSKNAVLVKYYIRFAISGVILFILIAGRVVDPFGLIVGLSVVVASIFLATLLAVKKLIVKEAV